MACDVLDIATQHGMPKAMLVVEYSQALQKDVLLVEQDEARKIQRLVGSQDIEQMSLLSNSATNKYITISKCAGCQPAKAKSLILIATTNENSLLSDQNFDREAPRAPWLHTRR